MYTLSGGKENVHFFCFGWPEIQLLARVEKLAAEDFADGLREVMGHTPQQVLMGVLLGLGVGLLV